jgi:hypothetical protein
LRSGAQSELQRFELDDEWCGEKNNDRILQTLTSRDAIGESIGHHQYYTFVRIKWEKTS